MTELIQSLVNVRDALSLIAFLSLVLLVAFRTRKVPELFFGLVRDKLTRQQFAALLHRFVTLALIMFLTLAALAALAQVLSFMTKPGGLTINDLRSELAKLEQTEDQKIRAEALYNLAMTRLEQRDIDSAIQSLEASIAAVPTLTAQEMVTYLYRRKRDFEGELLAWQRAVRTAREQGDTVAQVRLDRIGQPTGLPEREGEHDLIGSKTPLSDAGNSFETAPAIKPGLYDCRTEGGCFDWWYAIGLRPPQILSIRLRSPPAGGLAGAGIYGTNGQLLAQAGDAYGTMRGNAGPLSTIHEVQWVAKVGGHHFIRIGADSGTVFRFEVR